MNLGDSSRRKRRILLLLASILVPAALLITFAFRLVRQDAELAEARVANARREALVDLGRNLSATLEDIKLQEVNRWTPESEGAVPARVPGSPVVFVAPIIQNQMILPWDRGPARSPVEPDVTRFQREGEALEFRQNDPDGAVDAFRAFLAVAQTPHDRCAAQLWIGRNLLKASRPDEASLVYQTMLEPCRDVSDVDGISFGLYAAERLISEGEAHSAEEYVLDFARIDRWRQPTETHLLHSLLADVPGEDASQLATKTAEQVFELEQLVRLATEFPSLAPADLPFRTGLGNTTWLAYGSEPWFITVVSPAVFASPFVLAIASSRVMPPDAGTLSIHPADGDPLGEGFIDVFVDWGDDRFVPETAVPIPFYAMGIGLILAVTAFAGHLLLRDVNREVETAQMRSQFVASVSHELKTPLTAIRMFAETVAQGRFESERQRTEYMETIVNESERLSRLVDNVLDFSRIELGKKIFRMELTSLSNVVESAARAMQYPLSQQGFDLRISIGPDTPSLIADADALEQTVLNLLTNAVKYSGDSRQIGLFLRRKADEAIIEVRDHGLGIAPEEQARIFEKFYRVHSSESDRIAGAGLGLTIAHHIVQAHGGRLEVSSVPGNGSTFSVRLPLDREEGRA